MAMKRDVREGAPVAAPDPCEEAVARSCRFVGHGHARSVRVVVGRRLTYEDLARCRAWAAASGVNLVMDSDGVVTIRVREVAGASARAGSPQPRGSWPRLLHARDVDHAPGGLQPTKVPR